MSDIEITDVTDGAEVKLNLAAFDHLMTSVETRLDDQFNKNRINGPQYAEVYLGSVQTVMAQAIQFVLQEQVAQQQAELLEQQILTEVQNTAKAAAEVSLIGQQELVAVQQAAKLVADIALVEAETTLTAQKELSEVETTALITANAIKVASETDLLDQKELTEVQSTLKVAAETGLLDQKTDTEKAQILDTVNAAAVLGVIGKQKDLYTAQKDGFARDAEQKVLKILIDTWNVQRTTLPENVDPFTGITDSDLTTLTAIAVAGIS